MAAVLDNTHGTATSIDALASAWEDLALHALGGGTTTRSGRGGALSTLVAVRLCRALAKVTPPWCLLDDGPVLGRSHRRVLLADSFDAWVLAWPHDLRTELHDHGDAGGAFVVVDGRLVEVAPGIDGSWRRRVLTRGSTSAFVAGALHDVVNPAHAVATSVHVYSPPIASMTYFGAGPGGEPWPLRSEGVEDEPLQDLRIVAEHRSTI